MNAATSGKPGPAPRDPGLCPLCGQPNDCAVAAGRDGETCWCSRATFPAGLLEELRALGVPTSCVCAECVRKAGGKIEEEEDLR